MAPLPAPNRGWNARNALYDLGPDEAAVLDNFYPQDDRIVSRPGFSQAFPLPTTAPIKAVMSLNTRLLAAYGGVIQDVTFDRTFLTAQTSDDWWTARYRDSLYGFNGFDAPWVYDGVRLTPALWTTSGAVPLDPRRLDYAIQFKQYWVMRERGALGFWHAVTAGAVQGDLAWFDLSLFANKGGSIQAIGTWSADAGDGMDDRVVFVTTEGEFLVYEGADPNSDFRMVGRYEYARPLGRRCLAKVGGELLILTREGVMAISAIVQGGRENRAAITDRVRGAFAAAADDGAGLDGWQIVYDATGDYLLVNVPRPGGIEKTEQFVMNPRTGAWARWTGLPATVWTEHRGRSLFGAPGGWVNAFGGVNSDVNRPIPVRAVTGFADLGAKTLRKRVRETRPHIGVDAPADIYIATLPDWRARSLDGADETAPAANGETKPFQRLRLGRARTLWDVGRWGVDFWDRGVDLLRGRVAAPAEGVVFAVELRARLMNARFEWQAHELQYERGGLG